VILMTVPAYVLGQQRDRLERSATGRTAVPREEAVQAAPARQTDRRAEPRGETRRPAPREEKSDDAAPPRAGRERRSTPSAAETVRGRLRERPQAAPGRTYWTSSPRMPGGPASIALPDHGLRPFPDREHRRPGQRDGDYRPRYRRPHSGANVVFVPYTAPVVVEREVVVERDVVTAGAPVIVEQPSLTRLILDIHPPTAQVFADGYYIGIPEDFRFEDGGAVLEPGPHRIDIIARGYEPVSFNVNLTRGQSATFRHILTPIMRAPQPAPDAAVKAPTAAKQPATFYLIPGCYMGNVPPREANLPATCDIGRAVSVQY
jgi:hypothetical protein